MRKTISPAPDLASAANLLQTKAQEEANRNGQDRNAGDVLLDVLLRNGWVGPEGDFEEDFPAAKKPGIGMERAPRSP